MTLSSGADFVFQMEYADESIFLDDGTAHPRDAS